MSNDSTPPPEQQNELIDEIDEKSASKKIDRKKDKFTNVLAQADERLSGAPAKLTEEEKAKLIKELQAVSKSVDAVAVKVVKDDQSVSIKNKTSNSSGPSSSTNHQKQETTNTVTSSKTSKEGV